MNMINLLNEQLNLNIEYAPIMRNSNNLQIKDEYLKKSLLLNMENSLGTHVLKMSMPIEAYSRYKDNTISSMIKENGKVIEHKGHHEIKVADILDNIFYEISYHYTNRILEEFRDYFQNLQSLVYQTQQNIITHIDYKFNKEYINNLSSISEFFQELYEDMSDISASKSRSESYLTNIIRNRQELLKLNRYFLDNLSSWTIYNGKLYINNPDYNALANDYLLYRQTISNYAMCLIFEHILSGSLTNNARDKMIKKIEKKYLEFNKVDEQINNILRGRQGNNYYWYHHNFYNKTDYHNIDNFLNNYQDNKTFEIDEIEKLFDKSKELLENIEIK